MQIYQGRQTREINVITRKNWKSTGSNRIALEEEDAEILSKHYDSLTLDNLGTVQSKMLEQTLQQYYNSQTTDETYDYNQKQEEILETESDISEEEEVELTYNKEIMFNVTAPQPVYDIIQTVQKHRKDVFIRNGKCLYLKTEQFD